MAGEKFEDPSNNSQVSEHHIAKEDESNNTAATSGACQPPESKRSQSSLDHEYDPLDTALDHWTLGNHLRAIIKESEEGKLPPQSSKTSLCWNELRVRGAGVGVTHQQTVGQILRLPVTLIEESSRHRQHTERVILHGIQGVLMEGQMLLVLGRPGSGCSTLLKSLCGLTDEYLGWEGQLRYNGVDLETFKRCFRGDAVYTSDGKSSHLWLRFVLTRSSRHAFSSSYRRD